MALSSARSAGFGPELAVPFLEGRLLPEARKQQAEERLAVPGCFEEFLELMQEALRDSSVRSSELVSSESPSSPSVPLAPNSSQEPELRELAEALWDRLQFFRRERESEADKVASLGIGDQGPGAGDEESEVETNAELSNSELASDLVDTLRHGEKAFERARSAERRVQKAVYALLVKRFGDQPEFQELKPKPPDTSNLLVRAMLLNALGNEEGATQLLNLVKEIEGEARAQPPPSPG